MMKTQKLLDTYMLVGEGISRAKYEIFSGDEGAYAFITIYANEPHFHIKGYDYLKLDETVDVRSQIEGHFADSYQ
ncbi:DNA gyrase subunit beta [Klebsiella quasipneumoniae]|uniref:DNA gyrase subunit B n=1 Tax=Klebsiella quasipneumoniae TaxID=1463165 RepID=UPI000A0F2512|nr:DNA gyrase subunit B [Klebsiella quasipneumoniae]SMG68727.1 DNA gyrase subunit beta [Klebsiella quasipneumoniae]